MPDLFRGEPADEDDVVAAVFVHEVPRRQPPGGDMVRADDGRLDPAPAVVHPDHRNTCPSTEFGGGRRIDRTDDQQSVDAHVGEGPGELHFPFGVEPGAADHGQVPALPRLELDAGHERPEQRHREIGDEEPDLPPSPWAP